MYRSGLPNGHLAMVGLLSRDSSVGRIRRNGGSDTDPMLLPAGHDRHRLSNDLFTCQCVFSVRPLSMDERHEAQDDNPHRSG